MNQNDAFGNEQISKRTALRNIDIVRTDAAGSLAHQIDQPKVCKRRTADCKSHLKVGPCTCSVVLHVAISLNVNMTRTMVTFWNRVIPSRLRLSLGINGWSRIRRSQAHEVCEQHPGR
jgi:hypothetical protein